MNTAIFGDMMRLLFEQQSWEQLAAELDETSKCDWCELFDKVQRRDLSAVIRQMRYGELTMEFSELPESLYEACERSRLERQQREREQHALAEQERIREDDSWEPTCCGAYDEILRRAGNGRELEFAKHEVIKRLREHYR